MQKSYKQFLETTHKLREFGKHLDLTHSDSYQLETLIGELLVNSAQNGYDEWFDGFTKGSKKPSKKKTKRVSR